MSILTLNPALDLFTNLYSKFNTNLQNFPTGVTFSAPNTLSILLNGVPDLQVTLPFFEDKVLTGFVPTITGAGPYTLNTTPGTYQLGGAIYSLGATATAIPAADPFLDRIDLLVVDNVPGTQYIPGTASATPVQPAIPVGTLAVTFIFVSNTGAAVIPGPTPAAPVDTPNFLRLGASAVGVNVKGNFGSGANILFNFDGSASAVNNLALASMNKRFHGSAYATGVLLDNANQIIATKGIKGIQNLQIGTLGQIDYGAGLTTATTPSQNFMLYCGALNLIDNQTNRNAYFWAGGTMRGTQNLQIGGTVTVNPTFAIDNCQLVGVTKTFSVSDTDTTFLNYISLEKNVAPSITTNKLYRIGPDLYFNGFAVGSLAPILPGTVNNSMIRWDSGTGKWTGVGANATIDTNGTVNLQRNVLNVADYVYNLASGQYSFTQTRPTGVPSPFNVKLQGRIGVGADGTGTSFQQLFVGNGNPGTTFTQIYQEYDEPTGIVTSRWGAQKTGETFVALYPLLDNATVANRRAYWQFQDITMPGENGYIWFNGRRMVHTFDDTSLDRGELQILRNDQINTTLNTYANHPVFLSSQGAQTAVGVTNVVFAGFSNPSPAPAIQHALNNFLITSNFIAYASEHCAVRLVNANYTFIATDTFVRCSAGTVFNLQAPGVTLLQGRRVFFRNQNIALAATVNGNGANVNGGASVNVPAGTGISLIYTGAATGWYTV